jgi:hypothetical protein
MSTRRSFLRNCALAAFGFTVLPPATTYSRLWRATRVIETPPMRFEMKDFAGKWQFVMVGGPVDLNDPLAIRSVPNPDWVTPPQCELIMTHETARELGLTKVPLRVYGLT